MNESNKWRPRFIQIVRFAPLNRLLLAYPDRVEQRLLLYDLLLYRMRRLLEPQLRLGELLVEDEQVRVTGFQIALVSVQQIVLLGDVIQQ